MNEERWEIVDTTGHHILDYYPTEMQAKIVALKHYDWSVIGLVDKWFTGAINKCGGVTVRRVKVKPTQEEVLRECKKRLSPVMHDGIVKDTCVETAEWAQSIVHLIDEVL